MERYLSAASFDKVAFLKVADAYPAWYNRRQSTVSAGGADVGAAAC
jgi:hypothetical protein